MSKFDPDEIARWCRGTWFNGLPLDVDHVCHDTRDLKPGSLYVAIRGENHDGHAYVAEAFGKGASAALVNRSFAVRHADSGSLLGVDDTVSGLQDLARGFRANLGARMMAITGSVGKTTVKEMIADVMATRAATARTLGNWNNHIGLPLSLLAMSREDEVGVFEIGMNHPGELTPLCEILKPSCGIMTSIGPAHLEHFSSVRDIAAEKATMLAALPEDGLAVLSRDEPWYPMFREAAPGRVVTISLGAEADFSGVSYEGGEALQVWERGLREPALYQMPLPGEYIMRDALLAIAVGRLHGIAPDTINDALRGFRPLSMRWNVVKREGVSFINDAYNANPVSMRAALQAFARMAVDGRKWLVLGGMLELGAAAKEAHIELGKGLVEDPFDGLIAVGKLGAWIAEGARQAGWSDDRAMACDGTREAADRLRETVKSGDAVLLKASRGEKLEKILENWSGGVVE